MAASMQHYRFTLAYNGARYHGLQRQTKEVFASFQSQQPCQRLATPKATDQESVPLQKRRRLSKDAIPLTIQDFLERAFWMYVQSADSNNGKDDTKGRDSLDDSSPTSPVLPSSIAELRIRFAGRTDRGVHARGQVVTCFLPIKERHYGSLLGALNSRLPDDISLQSVTKVPPDFNPRKHPKVRKVYSYTMTFRRIDNTAVLPLPSGASVPSLRHPLAPSTVWLVPWPLYLHTDTVWKSLAETLQGTHDYAPFCHRQERKSGPQIRTISSICQHVVQERPCPYFVGTSIVTMRWEFTAAGFARGLVRHLAGFLVHATTVDPKSAYVSQNGHDPTVFDVGTLWEALSNPDHAAASHWRACIQMAPACGLCLESVTYDVDESDQ